MTIEKNRILNSKFSKNLKNGSDGKNDNDNRQRKEIKRKVLIVRFNQLFPGQLMPHFHPFCLNLYHATRSSHRTLKTSNNKNNKPFFCLFYIIDSRSNYSVIPMT